MCIRDSISPHTHSIDLLEKDVYKRQVSLSVTVLVKFDKYSVPKFYDNVFLIQLPVTYWKDNENDYFLIQSPLSCTRTVTNHINHKDSDVMLQLIDLFIKNSDISKIGMAHLYINYILTQ